MASLNDPMIEEVFAALAEHRPQLKTLQSLSDEEEGNPAADTRFIADVIIRAFPWPIGVELRRLFSAQLMQPDRMRLDQLFKTFERTLQFVCFALAAQVLESAGRSKLEIKPNIAAEFLRRWPMMTLGNLVWMIAELKRILVDNGMEPFMPEAGQALNDAFFKTCASVVPDRNDIGHYKVTLTEEEIQIRCMELQDRLMKVLKDLGFLAKYKLVSVRSINVEKHRRSDAHYTHLIHLLNSANSDFKAQELDEVVFTDTKSVLLLRTSRSIVENLNLSPFIIDTSVERIDTKEKMTIKKDIFLYSSFRNDVIDYVGTEAVAKHDLRALSNYATLVGDMKDFMRIFNP